MKSLFFIVPVAFVMVSGSFSSLDAQSLSGNSAWIGTSQTASDYGFSTGGYSNAIHLSISSGWMCYAKDWSAAFGNANAQTLSTAGGDSAAATYSTAFGHTSNASNYSTAIGLNNTANSYSTAIGGYNLAIGTWSTSLGYSTTAKSYVCTAIGQFNAVETNPYQTGWSTSDYLFVIGDGNGIANDPKQTHNALSVYKNGDVKIAKAQGDILMGEFGN